VIRSVHIAAYGHYNAVAADNQTNKFLKLSNRFLLMGSIGGFGMNVALRKKENTAMRFAGFKWGHIVPV
jgi:hypothetical protein